MLGKATSQETDEDDCWCSTRSSKLGTITEEGVRFLSPHDSMPKLLMPEHSISLQDSTGSDM
ncbi:hypothetical protein QBC47DRAFT_403518 [Echria macrotheca]|uniref:Uncharacterized protein n=1 Tax=Echria macrotheca TaxID=438768 RepID=A0AAJ0B9U7_9PEZI|nr:hypothetical protein QBC47DRAFT_403518 [Echria macrotheca]